MTPKEIAKRIKAKGLQRLRWYCQMCSKQCRDENGFKCHTLSEGHRQQMNLYLDNPKQYQAKYSTTFEQDFLSHLSRCFGANKVKANSVYTDFIKDRHHQHMNSTKWASLTEFVLHLGKQKKVLVEETPKGWFIQYIPRDQNAIKKAKQEKQILNEEFVENHILEMQIKNAQLMNNAKDSQEDEEFEKPLDLNTLSNLKIQLNKNVMGERSGEGSKRDVEGNDSLFNFFENDDKTNSSPNSNNKRDRSPSKSDLDSSKKIKESPLDEILKLGLSKKSEKRYDDRRNDRRDDRRDGKYDERKYDDRRDNERRYNDRDDRRDDRRDDKHDRKYNERKYDDKRDDRHDNKYNERKYNDKKYNDRNEKRDDIKHDDRKYDEKKHNTKDPKKEEKKESGNTDPKNWLLPNIYVKVLNKELSDGRYYKKKGLVLRTHDNGYVADLQMEDMDDQIRLDQTQLETVIPRLGGNVLVLFPPNKGASGTLLDADYDNFCCTIKLQSGKILEEVPYEGFSKTN